MHRLDQALAEPETRAADLAARKAGVSGVPSFFLDGYGLFSGAVPAEQMAGHVLNWRQDRDDDETLCGELRALKEQVAQPGACARASSAILDLVRVRESRRAA